MNQKTKTIFYSLIIIFILLLILFQTSLNDIFYLGMIFIFLFFILGIFLIILARKEKKKSKFFLLLTGISAISPFLGSVLHNVFYALAIIFENSNFLKLFFEILHGGFFLIAMVVSPITFIGGVVGVFWFSKRK